MELNDSWRKIEVLLEPWSVDKSTDKLLWDDHVSTPVSELFAEFRQLSVAACKEKFRLLEKQISDSTRPECLYRYFYLSLIEQMVVHKVVHHNLNACEPLLERKVRAFLDQAKKSGCFPPLSLDDGRIPALIFCGKFIPLETYHADVIGVSRAILMKACFIDKVRIAKYVFLKMRGLSPVVAYHLPRSMDKRFTVECVKRDHEITVEIFRANKYLRATYQSSWFLDPVLLNISPHLGAIGKFVTNDGSLLICIGETETSTKDAILKSRNRRKLYNDGKYKPKRFLRLWSRKDILCRNVKG